MKARKGKGLFVFCCLAPAAILFIVFMILPTIDIFRMSMFKWGGYTDNKTFVGLDNFKILFKSDKFYQAFQNSILLIVLIFCHGKKLKEKHFSVLFSTFRTFCR